MLPYEMIAGGTITTLASLAAQDIQLVSQNPPDYFEMKNITQWGTDVAQDVMWWWQRSMAQDTAKGINQTVTTGALNSVVLASGGISCYDTLNPPLFVGLTASAVNATTGVATMANTGSIAVGDTVRLISPTGMLQAGGIPFTVTAVTANTNITLGYIGVVGAGVNATTTTVLKYIPSRFRPRAFFISNVTKAVQAVITFTQAHDYVVGEEVSFRVPEGYGMTELNNRKGTVQSVTASTITVTIDTTGFTTFAYPASGVALSTKGPAIGVPAGSGIYPNALQPHTTLEDAFDNRNTRIIHLGASIFTNSTSGDVWEWKAFKYSQYNGQ